MLLDKTIAELSAKLRSKEISAVDLVEEAYNTITKHQKEINSFITLRDKSVVLKEAETSDHKRHNDVSPLYGIPFVLKDSYVTKGIRTTAASNVLSDYLPQYSSTVYQHLLDAGALLIGKNNMDAWGHGGTNENTDFKPVKNPWDVTRVAGGSGGGTAASISARMATFGIGEDTGGSIRNPAAWTNTTGLKVSYGRVSRYGCISYASSFDTVGPAAKTVEDCAYVLQEIAGVDSKDATSSPSAVPNYSKELVKSVKGITVGIPEDFYGEGLDSQIHKAIDEAVGVYGSLGAVIKKVKFSLLDYAIPVYYLIGPSETSSNLARYDGLRYGYGRDKFTDETCRRIMIGTYGLSSGYYDAYYKKAQQVRTLFIKEYSEMLSKCDVLLAPVTPYAPTKIGELVSDPLQNILVDIYTVTTNPVGIPALALPCGFDTNKLPIGMQIMGPMFSEDVLLRIGHAYQMETNWHKIKPPILDK